MARTRYRLAFPSPHTHLIEVEARFADAAAHGSSVDLHMAAWTPGSYLVRDYARHVQDVVALDERGAPLAVEKQDKASWRVQLGSARDLLVRYRVYAWELTVRTSHVDGTHAFVNGAPTYLWLRERAGEPAEVHVDAPPGWRVVTGLTPLGSAHAAGHASFVATGLDELIDSPIHAAPGPVHEFEAAGRPTQLAVWGRPELATPAASAGANGTPGAPASLDVLVHDVRTIVEHYARLFGGDAGPAVPYERYAFQLMLAPGAYGGLEHRASTALLSSPFAFSTRKRYEELLELVSHEYFHLWNVKRIRPRALGPFDYTRENYTRALWIMEGVTSYYDRYTLRRTGLQPARRYLEKLAQEWGKLVATPGRFKQSLEESSFDAWVKLYRPDENSVNTTVSYYLKGGIVTLCLDLEIKKRTGGKRGMDDVLRRLWREYGAKDVGFDEAAFRDEVERAVELDLGEFWARSVVGREDPDLAGALASVGLELKASWEKPAGEGANAQAPAWLGTGLKSEGGRAVVTSTLAESPAEAAGLYAGDEIVALDGWKVASENALGERLSARKPGDTVRLTLFRRDELREVEVALGEAPRDKFEIVARKDADAGQRVLYEAWMGEKLGE
jgi:predicted metalloprotease with PDZ domain